jgi:serine/threonine-protein kinase HipA
MMFVQSLHGISHNKIEDTKEERLELCVRAFDSLADAIRRHGSAPRPDLIELWRRLVFGRLINNCDDHLRNHGFLLLDAGGWRLSPAYDINPVPEHERRQFMATPVAPGRDGGVAAAMEVSASFGLALPQAKEELRRIIEAMQDWKKAGILDRNSMMAYSTAFENEEKKEAWKLIAPSVSQSAIGKSRK